MKSIVFLCFIFLSLLNKSMAECPTAPLVITSQDSIDQFAVIYPGCTVIDVDIILQGPHITNLHGLGHLTELWGHVSISGTSITDLQGLSNLRVVNVLEFLNNNSLASLDGIDSLDITRLTLNNNAAVNDLTALLSSRNIRIIDFSFNPSLTNLSGLDSLKRVETIFLSGNSQLADVDGLKNIRVITGNCSFLNNGNSRLPAFVSLDSIYGSLAVSKNKTLINLRGLDSLKYVGGEIFIAENDGLLFLTGLENLQSAYRMIVSGNRKLINLLGISSIKEITNELFVSGNHSLADLKGLDSIRIIGEDCTISGIHLTSLNGLDQLDTILGSFILNYNYELTNADAINDLEYIGGDFRFSRNDAIEQLPGFENLAHIDGDLFIQDNANLSSLLSFTNLHSINGSLHISGHPLITSLEGIDMINPVTIQNLEIYENANLSVCHVESMCQYLLLQRPATVHDNHPGCNSIEEINAQCVVATEHPITDQLYVYPNPAEGYIQLPETTPTKNITLYTSCGELAKGYEINVDRIDISTMLPGMYFIVAQFGSQLYSGKFLKI